MDLRQIADFKRWVYGRWFPLLPCVLYDKAFLCGFHFAPFGFQFGNTIIVLSVDYGFIFTRFTDKTNKSN